MNEMAPINPIVLGTVIPSLSPPPTDATEATSEPVGSVVLFLSSVLETTEEDFLSDDSSFLVSCSSERFSLTEFGVSGLCASSSKTELDTEIKEVSCRGVHPP